MQQCRRSFGCETSLLAAGARVSVCTADLTTPVHIAAQRSWFAQCFAGVPLNDSKTGRDAERCYRYLRMQDGAKQSLLHHAARSGNIETVRMLTRLLKEQGEILELDRIAKARKKKKSKLVVAGVLDPRDRWHRTPLHWAIVNGHINVVTHLLNEGALAQPYDPHHMKRMENRISASTHLPMETPLQLSIRLHGADSQFAALLR